MSGPSASGLPSLTVRRCDDDSGAPMAQAVIEKRLGTLAADFPKATVDLCFDDKSIQLLFTAFDERSYYVNANYTNNDPIWEYTVLEAFIGVGLNDPTSYLEFEVAPNNVTWTAYIQNPNKDWSSHAKAVITDLDIYPILARTTVDDPNQMWKSAVSLPLSMFNLASGEGTEWRMNFFRTYFADSTGAPQEYGAWSPNEKISFHQTPYFGVVEFADAPRSPGEGSAPGSRGPDSAVNEPDESATGGSNEDLWSLPEGTSWGEGGDGIGLQSSSGHATLFSPSLLCLAAMVLRYVS